MLCQESHLRNTTLLRTVLEAKYAGSQIRHSMPSPTESQTRMEFVIFLVRYGGLHVSVLRLGNLLYPSSAAVHTCKGTFLVSKYATQMMQVHC